MKPLLEIFTVCWNEEKILQDFITWYRSRVPNCLITVYDNISTDNTVGIALDNECKVIPFDTNGEMDELTLMNIRNNCWKDSDAKWCLVVDADELVDIDLTYLMNSTFEMVKCKGYEMFGIEEDTIETLVYGCESFGYCKPVLFQPKYIRETNFAPGSHSANPILTHRHPLRLSENNVKLFHTKWRSYSNGIERAHLLAKKRSKHSASMGWNIHYQFDDSIHKDYYENGIRNRVKVR
jgi:glycosyltransferase involved in cell wall biosynthesis